tara:strand:- start:820 stop:1998 length:1179 start_codon:yes stop_codon:yes gene_type:complete
MDNIERFDESQAFVSVRERAWHGLGTVIPEATSTSDMMELAHMANWNVSLVPSDRQPLTVLLGGFPTWDDDGKAVIHRDQVVGIEDRFAVVRNQPTHSRKLSDKNGGNQVFDGLAIVGTKYQPVQNEQLFSFGQAIVDSSEHSTWETMGSIRGGKVVFGTLKLGKDILIQGQDVVSCFLVLVSSHDGSTGVRAMVTPIRVVCENTLRMAMNSKIANFTAKHTASIDGKIQDAQKALGVTYKFLEEFEATATILSDRKVDSNKFEEIYAGVYGDKPVIAEGGATNSLSAWENRLDDMLTVYQGTAESGVELTTGTNRYYQGDTMRGISGTAWGSVNAMTEFLDWYGTPKGRLERAAGFQQSNELMKSNILRTTLDLTGGVPKFERKSGKLQVV